MQDIRMFRKNFFLAGLFLLVSELAYICYAAIFFYRHHTLPAPLASLDPNDSFMDFYHTAWWGNTSLMYEMWQSIYPPFVFWITRVLSTTNCNSINAFYFRDCYPEGVVYIFLTQALACFFSVIAIGKYINLNNLHKIILTFVLYFSMPSLFLLERGNLLCFALLFVALSVIVSNRYLKVIFLTLVVNIKQYLVVLEFSLLFYQNLKVIIFSGVFFVLIYLLSIATIGNNGSELIVENMLGFVGGEAANRFEKMWYPTSFGAWTFVAFNEQLSPSSISNIEVFIFKMLAIVLRVLSISISLTAVYLAIYKNKIVEEDYFQLIILLCLISTVSAVGGYSLVLIFPYLGILIKKINSNLLLLCIFILLFPFDYGFLPRRIMEGYSFLSNQDVIVDGSLTIGSYIRPFVISFIQVLIIKNLFLLKEKLPYEN